MPHGLFSEGRDYDGIDLEGLESVGRSHMRSSDLLDAIFCPRKGWIFWEPFSVLGGVRDILGAVFCSRRGRNLLGAIFCHRKG